MSGEILSSSPPRSPCPPVKHPGLESLFSFGRSAGKIPRVPSWLTLLGVLIALGSPVRAQELEPRAYSNLPVGINFAVGAYAHSEGGLATDPSLPVEDAHFNIDTVIAAYARSLALWGMSGKFDMIVPYSWLSGTALVAGQPAERVVDGFLDPRFRVSINFYGAPALGLKDYAKFAADKTHLVFGGSVQVSAPFSQYDPSRLVNLGTNRWSIKPEVGFSKQFQALTFDLTLGTTFFTDNDNFYGGQHVVQDPLYSTQANLSYDFGKGIWAALGYTYYSGGRTTVNGVRKDNELGNSRVGLTVTFPINRYYSIKFNASTGISTRTGTDFDTAGVALQYRWGLGL